MKITKRLISLLLAVCLLTCCLPFTAGATTRFYDVSSYAYYADAVDWAVSKGIAFGTGNGRFSPEAACTRADAVTFIWRAAGCPNPKSTYNPFRDVSSTGYYYKAVLWAVEQGIAAGTSRTSFAPGKTCTRGQIVTFLYREAGEPSIGNSVSEFADVDGTQYYHDAVIWATRNKITAGSSHYAFSPSQTCTRGQIVTFLYRAAGQETSNLYPTLQDITNFEEIVECYTSCLRAPGRYGVTVDPHYLSEINGKRWFTVVGDLNTKAGVKANLRRYMTQKLVNELWDDSYFLEKDGTLYAPDKLSFAPTYRTKEAFLYGYEAGSNYAVLIPTDFENGSTGRTMFEFSKVQGRYYLNSVHSF